MDGKSGVDHLQQRLYAGIWVFVDLVGWSMEVKTELIDMLIWDESKSERSNVAQVFRRIISPESLHGDVRGRNPQTPSQTLREIGEDLRLRQRVYKHKGIVEGIQETDLDNGGIFGLFLGTSIWEDNLRQVRGNTEFQRSRR